METIWFCLVALMLAIYVLLDGFDLGAGIIHLFIARTDHERREVLAAIGPVWDGNEVWLLASGGTLYFAFPSLYASGFSGFYLALMVVLWLLMLRGISIEFRNHIHNGLWRPFWDTVFCGSSVLLAIFYGAALGNVVRGVPLDKDGFFFVSLWTNFQPGPHPGIIDDYTVLVGVTALLVLALHGSLWIVLKTTGELQERAHAWSKRLIWAVDFAACAISAASFGVQPQLSASFAERPWMWIFPALSISGLVAVHIGKSELRRFLGSSVYIIGALLSAVGGLYPDVMPAVPDAALSLTIYNASAPPYGLRAGFFWFFPGLLLAMGYSIVVYYHFRGKVDVSGLHD